VTEPLAIALLPETVEALVEALVEPLVERVLARLQVGQEPHAAEWMTVEQAAEYAGRSVSAIRHLIDRRKLPKHQPVRGGRIMLRRWRSTPAWAARIKWTLALLIGGLFPIERTCAELLVATSPG
jgi:excisionase family DNA binding protein